MATINDLRNELVLALNKDVADPQIFGKLELPATDGGNVVVRFNTDAYAEFPLDAVVRNSITALSCKERRDALKGPDERSLGLENWVHLKIRHGSKCVLHYKTVRVEFVLDRAVQQSFYIDTKALKCVYLEKRARDPKILQISCDEDSADRTNKEVTFYKHHCCCCNENDVDCYGYVSCDDGWTDGNCF